MSYQETVLGAFLSPAADEEPIDPERTYPTAGVYSYGRGLFKKPPVQGSETSYTRYTKLHEGQFVYSKLFGWEGAIATVGPEFDGLYVSHEFPTFTINPELADQRYVTYLARWGGLHAKLKDKGTGVGSRRQRVNVGRLLATTVPLPDLPEQRRIAARLDAAFGMLQLVDELHGQRGLLLNALGESAISQAVSQSVDSASIGSLMAPSRAEIHIDPDHYYRAFGMRSFGMGTIRYDATPGQELSKLRYFGFPAKALALSNIKAWEGAIGMTSDDDTTCVASNRFLFYLPRDNRMNVSYLRHYLLSKLGLAQISAASPGSADRNRTLSIKRFEAIEVPVPERDVQDHVAHLIDTATTGIGHNRAKNALDVMGPSLLNAAFGGKL